MVFGERRKTGDSRLFRCRSTAPGVSAKNALFLCRANRSLDDRRQSINENVYFRCQLVVSMQFAALATFICGILPIHALGLLQVYFGRQLMHFDSTGFL